ncbi:MAG: right-handed parallel beta-helix repeat-containing protein [Lewinellaceae bacterium]|nr:right-handed parallel beta-helix repeat-containing protein [Lewinellaceae bacterium]
MNIKIYFKTVLFLSIIISQPTFINAKNCLGCPGGGGGGGGAGSGINCNNYLSTQTLFVDGSRPDNTGDGKTWATAKKYLYSALDIANTCDMVNIYTIKVAQGIYKPTSGTDRNSTFFIGKSNLSIKGGFPPGGGNNVQNHVLYPTILDGEIASNVFVYHVLLAYDVNNVNISGFRIRNGLASGTGSIEVDNNVFINQFDGAGINIRICTSIEFTNCVFYNNAASEDGGGVFSNSSYPKFVNCIIYNNSAAINGGGIRLENSSTAALTHCALVNNVYTLGGGGAIYNSNLSNIDLHNSIVWGNSNTWNGGGERNIYHCVLQDQNTTNGGIIVYGHYSDPNFININDPNGSDNIWFTADDGLNVCIGSICLNRGDNNAPDINSNDIRLEPRNFNVKTDIGPYESQSMPGLIANSMPNDGDSTVARVWAGNTGLPLENCSLLAALEPSTGINSKFIAVAKNSLNATVVYNSAVFVRRFYYLQKFTPGDFNGKITLYFKNSDFTDFNNNPYSIDDLPSSTNISNKSHLRIIKFPGITNQYFPQFLSSTPEIINPSDADIVFNPITNYWSIQFDNEGELGTFFITTTHEFIFDGWGDFSEETNWMDNSKPNLILPSLNKITILQGSYCIFDEPLELEPGSTLIVE